MPGVFLVFLLVCLLCVVLGKKKQVIIFSLQTEENMGGDKKINGDVNQVDEEHSRRRSIFLSINPLKINTSRFDSLAARRR